MAHAHLPRRSSSRRHTQVAAAVDGAAPVALEPRPEKVGRPSFGRAPQVDLQAGWPTDHARVVVDLHRAPSGGRVRPSRAPGWRCPQRLLQRRGRHVRPRPAITGRRSAPRRVGSTRPALRDAARSAAATAARSSGRGRDGGPADPRSAATGRCPGRKRDSRRSISANRPTARRPRRQRRARPSRDRAHRRKAVVEHAPRRRRWSAVLWAVGGGGPGRWRPCRRRKPAAGPRSARDWTASSRAEAVAGSAPTADGGRAPPPRRPLPPPRLTNAPVKPAGATASPKPTQVSISPWSSA